MTGFAAVHESGFGPKRTFNSRRAMSAFGGKADIDQIANSGTDGTVS
jgi:hypothetical protein